MLTVPISPKSGLECSIIPSEWVPPARAIALQVLISSKLSAPMHTTQVMISLGPSGRSFNLASLLTKCVLVVFTEDIALRLFEKPTLAGKLNSSISGLPPIPDVSHSRIVPSVG